MNPSIISIEGTSGIGKSFLAAQLSALTRAPVIVEGGIGVIPDWIFESFHSSEDVRQRQQWFTERCVRAIDHAQHIWHQAAMTCFVDSGPLTHEAYLLEDERAFAIEPYPYWVALRQRLPHVMIVLTASDEYIRESIVRRYRPAEQNEQTILRALRVQRYCLQLVKDYDALVIPRDGRDFSTERDLKWMWETIQAATHSLHS